MDTPARAGVFSGFRVPNTTHRHTRHRTRIAGGHATNVLPVAAERENRIADAALARTIAILRRDLQQWWAKHACGDFDGARLPVTGRGQLAPADCPNTFAQAWPGGWLAGRPRRWGRADQTGNCGSVPQAYQR